MNESSSMLSKIAFIGDYLPRQCGIATFTHDLRRAIAEAYPTIETQVIAVTDPGQSYDYPPEVDFEIRQLSLSDYRRAAEFLQYQNVQCVVVQHEFGIFGGTAGSHLLTLLRQLRLPIVTTCHTLLEEPDPSQRRVFDQLCALSHRLVTMTERGRSILKSTYGVGEDRIDVIPHGIPDAPFVDPAFYKDEYGVEGRKLLLTFGLLSPGKGLEYAIRAMPRIVEAHPNAVYIILGATHPNLARSEGESYRYRLQQLVSDLEMEEHVLFFNRFVSVEELTRFIGACDVYVTPYLNPAQITSGTLAYAFGCGKAVVSTPYWHAQELLADGRGALVPFRDSAGLARAVIDLLDDDVERARLRKEAYLAGREMLWSRVAERYVEAAGKARAASSQRAVLSLERKRGLDQLQLPELKLDHVRRLTDSAGMFQHATFSFPNFAEGYCVDDNARALILMTCLEDMERESPINADLASVYSAFINYAYNAANGRFRNFMSFDRRWLEESGSDDSHGRALWALGVCVGRSRHRPLQNWASNLFDKALPAILRTRSPRGWAFALLGLHEFLRRLGGQRQARVARDLLARRLSELYAETATSDWLWFEPVLAYDNAKLSHALIVSGRSMGDQRMLEAGLESLEWLMRQQTGDNGYFAPIGCNGFYPKGGERARFDQQPLEAHASVSACLGAYLITRQERWLEEALRAFRWFLGSNDLGAQVCDYATGGCRDGLHIDRVNQNEGAESTLAFLLSLVEIKAHETALSAFREPVDLYEEPNSPGERSIDHATTATV